LPRSLRSTRNTLFRVAQLLRPGGGILIVEPLGAPPEFSSMSDYLSWSDYMRLRVADGYTHGHTSSESARLQIQARILSAHVMALAGDLLTSAKVADVGAGPGHMARLLRAAYGCTVDEIDICPYHSETVLWDILADPPSELVGQYDRVVLCCVLEHACHPWAGAELLAHPSVSLQVIDMSPALKSMMGAPAASRRCWDSFAVGRLSGESLC